MKIAMMTNSYKPFVAGVPISVERLTEGLRRMGHEVVVFAPSYDTQEEEQDVVRYGSLLRNVAGGIFRAKQPGSDHRRAVPGGRF